jgi:hypothetical protein
VAGDHFGGSRTGARARLDEVFEELVDRMASLGFSR